MKCMYCSKEIKVEECHNPEDFGLHTPYLDFKDKSTCLKCNNLVTITNRLLKNIIDTDYSSKSVEKLKNHIEKIEERGNL